MSDQGAPISAVRTNPLEIYDHAITLIDSTKPPPSPDSVTRKNTQDPDNAKLTKKTTRTSVRETLARRKYARWQQGRFEAQGEGDDGLSNPTASGTEGSSSLQPDQARNDKNVDTSDFAHHTQVSEPAPERSASKEKKKQMKDKDKQIYEVDILYENQRGMFFFGIPLYSHSSLLNFDPSPWVTKDLKDSPVNITNAQVPDPSWEWAWKTWYVDMSYDVDEEGWQYSFSFNKQFVWHGTHPWFHSYVRRRRWLRKRVKKQSTGRYDKTGSMGAGHMLNADYFTIHSQKRQSPATTLDGEGLSIRSSLISKQTATEEILPLEEIKNIPTLLDALRRGTIDREKIDAIKKFVAQGGEELAYLAEYIPEIMAFFVFQNSRRQLLHFLRKTLSDTKSRRDDNGAKDKSDDEAEKRKIKNLLNAVDAADEELTGLEYWTDHRNKLKTTDDIEGGERAPKKNEDVPFTGDSAARGQIEDNPVDKIRGISADAEIGLNPMEEMLNPKAEENEDEDEDKDEDKGK